MTATSGSTTSAEDEHVLVIGAGFVGLPAAERLAASGRRVTAVRRSPPARSIRDVDVVQSDVHHGTGLTPLPTDVHVVVFALPPDGRDEAGYRRTYLDLPRRVLQHLDQPPRLVLMTTSTAVYATDDGGWVNEDDVGALPSATAEVMRDGEIALDELVDDGLADAACSLRLGGIYGPGRTRLVDQVAVGEATCQEGRWTNRIHRDDAAGAIAHLVRLEGPMPTVLNVVDDGPALQCVVLGWLARQMGAPEPQVQPRDAKTDGRSVTNKRVTNSRLRALGFRPTHSDFRSGYADILAAR